MPLRRARSRALCLLQMPMNGGAARARNWGAMHATQPVLAFIDADDEYAPGALSVASGFLKQIPSAASIRLDVEYTGFPAEIIRASTVRGVLRGAQQYRTKQLDHSQAGLRGASAVFRWTTFSAAAAAKTRLLRWHFLASSATGVSPVPSLCACTIIRAPMPGTTSGFPWACRRRISAKSAEFFPLAPPIRQGKAAEGLLLNCAP